MAIETPTRYHALDALRAFALLLGIVFHAAESFCPERYSWAIVDRNSHVLFEIFQHTCHSFRMEVFFLIAGFFGNLVLRRRGLSGFVHHRSQRILVPLIVGWLLIYPAMITIWTWGKSSSGRLGDLGVPPEAFALSVRTLVTDFFLNLGFLGEWFSLTHLWFLYYLLLLYGCVIGVRWLTLKVMPGGFSRAVDGGVAWLMGGWWTVPVLATVTVPLIFPMDGVDTPDRSLVPNIPVLLVYGLFFGLGWLMYRQPGVLSGFKRGWTVHLMLGLLLVLPTYYPREVFGAFGLEDRWSFPHHLLYNSMYALMMWSFTAGISGFFIKYFPAENRIWRYVADSSYWLYLLHLLVVVPAQVIVAGWDLPAALKYLVINLTVFPILFASYHYLVRSTFIGQQLNGRKYRFEPLLLPRRQPAVQATRSSPVDDGRQSP